jgi:DNA primase
MATIDLREARRLLPLAAVLDLAGFVPSERRGDALRGPCPVHGSRRPRSRAFSAQLDSGLWHCFACGVGGDAFDLWARLTGLGLYEAIQDLCRRLGRDVPWLNRR